MKTRISFALLLCVLLCVFITPATAEETLTLQLEQAQECQPGQSVTLYLCLPQTELAGGFLTLQYAKSQFALTDVQLLQATDMLTLTWADKNGTVKLLLDAAQNVSIQGQLLALTFTASEEIQPGNYPVICTVPGEASFYALNEDGSSFPLYAVGCESFITVTEPPLPPCPARYLACQETNPHDDSIYVRICALINADTHPASGSYGFVLGITDANGSHELVLNGSDLTDTVEGGGQIYTAEQLGGQVFTATLSISARGSVSITLTPFVRESDVTLYGGSYTLLYNDGIYVETQN